MLWLCDRKRFSHLNVHSTFTFQDRSFMFFALHKVNIVDMLVISATQDHAVNPIASIELSKTLDCELVTLVSDCGHMSFACETEKIKEAITTFLQIN